MKKKEILKNSNDKIEKPPEYNIKSKMMDMLKKIPNKK